MSESPDQKQVAALIILAAGAGTRMKSRLPKVLHEVAGRSMLGWAVATARQVRPQRLTVVVGHQAETVGEHLRAIAPEATTALQAHQGGTGHAVRTGLTPMGDFDGEVVVTYADVPLLSGATLDALVEEHRAAANAITVLTAVVPDPHGYGRIIRDAEGQLSAIVEQRDADEAQRRVDEINSGIMVFDAAVLRAGLAQLDSTNAQGEEYLTDLVAYANGRNRRVGALQTADRWETEGVNNRSQLAGVDAEQIRRLQEKWMEAGVTIVDRATTRITTDVTLAADVTLQPGTILSGATTVGEGCEIGPETRLHDTEVGMNASVIRTEANLATIGDDATVGPFSYLRPGAELGPGAKVGAFVEIKASVLGAGAKVPHLSYVGDASIGAEANVGAGTIVANYDGQTKHRTTIGEASFVGCGTTLVAPVEVGTGTYVAAGSTITESVLPGELGIARGRQRNVSGWVGRKRAGAPTAKAAAASEHDAEQAP